MSLEAVRGRLGIIDGVLSCLAPPHERLPCPCWIVVQLWGAMATPPRSRTLLPLAATCLTCRESAAALVTVIHHEIHHSVVKKKKNECGFFCRTMEDTEMTTHH